MEVVQGRAIVLKRKSNESANWSASPGNDQLWRPLASFAVVVRHDHELRTLASVVAQLSYVNQNEKRVHAANLH